MNVKLRALTAGVIFFAGFSAQAQKASSDTTSVKEIDEVVVVAYSKIKKEAIVGSVAKVDKKIIETQQATSVLSSLQGTVSGLNIVSSGGQPGSNPSIYIRGVGSINASTQPLIILDGAPFGGNMNSIPQDQVESISVLKDASATSLYGSRAANGVIIISTKKGKKNSKPTVNLTSLIGVSSPAVKFHETLGAADFMKGTWQAIKNTQQYGNNLSESAASQYASNNLVPTLGYNPYNLANPIDFDGNVVNGARLLWDTDWKKEIIDNSAFKQEHRFNVSGGSENTTYFVGADYLTMEGGVKTSEFERIGVRMNIDSKVNDWLEVGLNNSFSTSYQNSPIQSGNSNQSPIQWIYSIANVFPLYQRDELGNMMLDGFGNPIYDYGDNASSGRLVNAQRPAFNNENAAGTLYNNRLSYKRSDVIANGYAQVNFTDYLNLRSQGSYQLYLYDANEYSHRQYGSAAGVGGRVAQNRDLAKTINFTNSLNFNKQFGNHNVTAQAIFEMMDYRYDALSAQGTGFLPNVFALNGSTSPESVGGYINQERLVSYLGRAAYNFKDKYFVEGSVRTDGSSRFAKENRWGTFFAVGGAWVISKENFMQDSFVNYLKLKGSYGELGNNMTTSYFPYLEVYDTGWNQLDQTGILLGNAVDYNLTWEKTATSNVGLEFGMFNNRITGNVEYFNRESIDLIYGKPLPGSTGNTSITTNVGALRNHGVEFDVSSLNIKKENFQWRTSLNMSFVKNEFTELTQKSVISGTKRWAVGQSLYDFYLVEWAGVNPDNGKSLYWFDKQDANGNITRETTEDYNLANTEASKRYVGSSLPDFTGGFTNYVKIGPVDLNALFNFSFGSQVYDSSYNALMSGFASAGRQQSVDVMNAWQKPGDTSSIPVNTMSQNNNSATSTRFLFDNDYVRLKSLTLGYNINKELLTGIGLSGMRIFAQADNLWTWQSHKGIDPEQSIAGTTDSRSYNLKTISLGFNVSF